MILKLRRDDSTKYNDNVLFVIMGCVLLLLLYVSENFLPDRVSSLILDLERDVVLPSTSSFLRVGLGLGLDVQVILVVGLHGWWLVFDSVRLCNNVFNLE